MSFSLSHGSFRVWQTSGVALLTWGPKFVPSPGSASPGQCASTLHVHMNSLGILLKGRFGFSRSGCNLRFCISNNSQMLLLFPDHTAVARPTDVITSMLSKRGQGLSCRKGEAELAGGFLGDTHHFCSRSLGEILVTRPCLLQGRLGNATLLGSHVHGYNSVTFKEQGADVGRQLPVPATLLYLKSPQAPPGDWWSPNQGRCTQKSVQDACQTRTSWHSFLQHILEIFPSWNVLSTEVVYLVKNSRVDFFFLHSRLWR